MRARSKFTKQHEADLIRYVTEGKCVREISELIGIGMKSIQGKLSSMHLKAAPDTFWTEARKEKLRALSDEGKTVNEIARQLGVSMPSVRSALAAANSTRHEYEPRRKLEKMPAWVRFDDHPYGDRDKRIGRVLRAARQEYSAVGSAAALCAGN